MTCYFPKNASHRKRGSAVIVHNPCGSLLFHWEEVTEFLLNITQAFDGSIGKDGHLAVAFFQRALTFYKKERQDKSIILGMGDWMYYNNTFKKSSHTFKCCVKMNNQFTNIHF